MSKAKEQHYLPCFLLRHFSIDSKKLWTYDRDARRYGYRKIERIFKRRHAYTIHKLDSLQMDGSKGSFVGSIGKDYRYDEEIQKLESAAAPIIKHMIEGSRQFVCPQLCIAKSNILKRFIFLMARRTPESHERVASSQRQLLQQQIPDLLKEYLQIDDDTIDRKEQIRRITDYLISNADARFSAGDMQNVRDEEERFCGDAGIRIMVIGKPKKRFIIGSHGLAIVDKDYDNDPSSGSWLPIAHDVAVSLTLSPEKEVLGILSDNAESSRLIDRVNSASAQSQVVAARTKKDLEDYVIGPLGPSAKHK